MCLGRDLFKKKGVSLSPCFLFSKILDGKKRPASNARLLSQFASRPTSVSNMAEGKQQRRPEGAWEWLKNLEDRILRCQFEKEFGHLHNSFILQTTGWFNRFFPLIVKSSPNPCSKGTRPQLPRHEALKFLVLLAGEVVLLQLCSMSRELCYTLLAEISKYGCQGLLSDTKPTRPKIDALLSGPVYLRTNHAMQGVQLLFFCF